MRWVVGVFVAVVVALGIAWVLFVPAAGWIAHLDVGSAKGSQLQTARDAAQGRLLTLGAGLFAAGALIFTARNYTLSREGQVTDRYTKAIEQLGSDNIDVRTGGIYSLERVARDSARDHATVIEVLAAFAREQSRGPWPPVDDQSTADVPLRMTRPDVQAAVAVIGRRDPKSDRQAVNLNSVNLTGADLTGAELADAKIDGADLTRANLADANLTGAQLNGADLTGANLVGANLTGAQLNGADLTGAQLNGADLTGARLTRANLTSADLTSARLADAWLPGVDFTHADLDSANLTGANLAEVTLTDANLRFADLTSANLTSANLTGANFSRVYLTNVVWPPDAAVPEGWQRDSGSGRLAGIPSATVEVAGVPGWVRQYLFPDERIVIAVRMHPVVLFFPVMLILAGALLAGIVTNAAPRGNATFVQIVWPLWIVLAAWQGWKIAKWSQAYFVVTDRRMILITGLVNREIAMIPLAKITDLSFSRRLFGRALGYGDIFVESAGQEQALSRVGFVPDPEHIYLEIVDLLFPGTAGRDEGESAS
jgi:uncharacterized protein YjbI with pentapeptide repeats